MAIFQFFRREKPRRFDHRPRYYDERKERIQNMMADPDEIKTGESYRAHLRRGWSKRRKTRVTSGSTLRVIALVIILVWLVDYFFL